MFSYIKRLYEAGRLTAQGVRTAVSKGWITEEQAEEILGGGD